MNPPEGIDPKVLQAMSRSRAEHMLSESTEYATDHAGGLAGRVWRTPDHEDRAYMVAVALRAAFVAGVMHGLASAEAIVDEQRERQTRK